MVINRSSRWRRRRREWMGSWSSTTLFSAIPEERRKLLPVWVPPTLTAAATPVSGSAKDADEDKTANAETSRSTVAGWVGGPVELKRPGFCAALILAAPRG